MTSMIFDAEVFQNLFDSADDLLFIVDDGGSVINANAAAYRTLGYTEKELSGKKVLELHPPEQRAEIARTVDRLLSGEMPFLPGHLMTKDGQKIPVEPRVSKVQIGSRKMLFGICRIKKAGADTTSAIVKGTILIVDDDEALLEVMEQILISDGYEVMTAHGGEEALIIFNKYRRRISLVVLDMMMPEMDGKEVYLKIKDIDPDAKILICSGYTPEGMVESLIGGNRSEYIQKPFNSSGLCHKVEKMIYE